MALATSALLQGVQFFSMSLNFQQVVAAATSSIPNRFDRYKIDKVVLKLIPLANYVSEESATNTQSQMCNGFLHSVTDYDDTIPIPASLAGVTSMRERRGYRVANMVTKRQHTFVIRPRIAVSSYGSGAFSSYANSKAQWIDTQSPSVEHYGWKGIFQVLNPSTASFFVNFQSVITYYMSFRDPVG